MKRLWIFLFALLPIAVFPQSFEQGCKAYEQGNYKEAVSQWEGVLKDGKESGEVFYNLGNAYYRVGDMAHAVLNYERAHRLMPRDKDTKENLALAYSKIEDKIAKMPQLFVSRWWQALVHAFGIRGWMWVCIVFLALVCVAAAVFFLSHGVAMRKASLATGGVLLFLLIIFSFAATNLSRDVSLHSEAIVMSPATVVKSSPDSGGLDKMVLHEGTKVWIEDEAEGWKKIRISDGNTGWLPKKDIEVI